MRGHAAPSRSSLRLAASAVAIRAGALLLVLSAGNYARGILAQRENRGAHPIRARGPSAIFSSPHEGDLVARLAIPRLDADLAVFEGVSDDVLRRGPGHLPGTALPEGPAASGNCVIAGHRDSFFHGIGRLRPGDRVALRTVGGETVYRIRGRRIVGPAETSVAASSKEPLLTLITCYPLDWIGPAPYRLVLVAEPIAPSGAAPARGNRRIAADPSADSRGSLSSEGAGRRTNATETRSAANTSPI